MAVVFEYLPKQKEFMTNVDEVSFAAYIGGFGSGKTHVLCLQSLREASIPSRGLIGASTYRMLEDTTQRKFFELCPPSWIESWRKSNDTLTLRNGSEIIFRNLESPGRLASLELDWFGLDEIGEVKQDIFRMLQGRLRKKGGRHRGFGVGNPAGPAHWTYEYFVILAEKYPNKYRLTQAPSNENTFLPEDYITDMTVSFDPESAYFKRYVLGQFCAFEGAYWENFKATYYPQGHILPYENFLSIFDVNERHSLSWGKVIDFGYENPFACLWYVHNGRKIVFYDEYYQRRKTVKEHCIAIRNQEAEHQRKFRSPLLPWAYTDHDAQCRGEIQNCHDDANQFIGFDCRPADKQVLEGILLVQALFGQTALFISDKCERTRREVSSYRSKAKSSKEEPLKEDDHTCDAMRMACQMEMSHMLPYKRWQDLGYQLAHTDLQEVEKRKQLVTHSPFAGVSKQLDRELGIDTGNNNSGGIAWPVSVH
jgi:PBSX family phage terminase large subunit